MDVKNPGMKISLHILFMMLWAAFSAAVYGSLCMLTAPVNRSVTRIFGELWNRNLLFFAGIRVKVNGLEKIDKNKRYVFIANHQSHVDIPVLIVGLQHQLSFIAKKELFRIPFFGWGMYALGHIYIDRSNARKARISIQNAISRLQKDNISLVLFPEGTRSKDGKVGQFRQGSFSLALKSGVEVVPVAIQNTADLLPKHSNNIKKGTAVFTVCDPIVIDESMTKAEISERIRKVIVDIVESGNSA
jgi:1-acyl-sn-glycerol-3-phosphate acyltransferase